MFFTTKFNNINETGFELLTELLGLPDYFVKDFKTEKNKIFLIVERQGDPKCPACGQYFMAAPKDNRIQTIEDLPAFGKRCYIKLWNQYENTSHSKNGVCL